MRAKRNDPTHTERLRQIFRGECQRRVRTLLTAARETLLESKAFGPQQSPTHPMMAYEFFRQSLSSVSASQLDMFTSWFNNAAYTNVVQQGTWLRPHIERAFQHGIDAGEKFTHVKMHASPLNVYYTQYKNELEGIVDATVQMATRAISTGLLNKERPATLYRRIVAVSMKVLEPRLRKLGHQIAVQQHNSGLLAQFRAANIKQVGVLAEKKVRKRARDHAQEVYAPLYRRDESGELVNVLTAGDFDVCPQCEDYAEGGPYDIEEVESTLPLHPDCRCSWVPMDDQRFAINKVRNVRELEAEE